MRLFPHTRAAFAIPDLLGLLVVLAVAASLALAAARQMRQEAQNASSLSQLRWLAGATSSYAADSNDQFWSYSWKAGPLPHSDPTLPATAASDLRAVEIQAVDILRRLSGRTDIALPGGWIPHVTFNHLPLVDYIGRDLPDFNLVAPGDRRRLKWARDPEAFDRGEFLPFQPDPTVASANRWPYTSSYLPTVGLFDLAEDPWSRIYQGQTQAFWVVPAPTTLGGADLTRAAFPSQKVMLYDVEQRELRSTEMFFAASEARAATLMVDGSAGLRATADSNYGWHPQNPTASFPAGTMRFRYEPALWEAQSGAGTLMIGHYRWTRGGIEGRDFGGPEVDTGQP